MPNWTENELTITGPDVNKVLEAIRSNDIPDQDKRILDFNRIIPYPQVYRDLDKRAEEYREKFANIEKDDPDRQQKLAALGAEYGVDPGMPWIADGFNSGGYEWCCDNWGCYDDQTEVLTIDGWKLFKDVRSNDEFFTLNQAGYLELHKSLGYVEKPYSGLMYHFKTKLIDVKVSPDHNMYVTTPRTKIYRFISAKDIPYCRVKLKQTGIWQGVEKNEHVLPTEKRALRTFQERRLHMDDFLEFLGYFLSEGSLNKRPCKRGGYQYYVRITQKKPDSRAKMIDCINRLNFKTYFKKLDIIINDFQLYLYLEQFGHAHEKYIPKDIKGLSSRQLKILLDALVLGDGTRVKSGGFLYYTTSRQLANDMQEIGLKVGAITSLSVDDRVGTVTKYGSRRNHKCYVISFYANSDKVGSEVNRHQIVKVPYQGSIYCVIVPNHTLFVRRNGKVVWCGNTKWNGNRVHLTTHADSSKPLRKTSKCAYCGTIHKTEAMIILTCQQCGSPIPDIEPIQAFLEFDTAWSPPLSVIAKLATMFPDHIFELKYFEGGMGFSGHARWSEGNEEFHHQYEYSGPRGG